MGYSAKYHATSLVAVFLALAIGILIGAEFGGDTLNQTRRNLEHSLTGNLQDARARADELSAELGRSDEFASRPGGLLEGEPAKSGRRPPIIRGRMLQATQSKHWREEQRFACTDQATCRSSIVCLGAGVNPSVMEARA